MRTVCAVFSPTGGTQKAAECLAKALDAEYQTIDLMKIDTEIKLSADDLCVIGMPVFGGRIPASALEKLSFIKGENTSAVLVAVYGNRSVDDALIELVDASKTAGFRCLAAVEAVAEHSIMHQFAAGRPDETDRVELERFAQKIRVKRTSPAWEEVKEVSGMRPYRKAMNVPLKPNANQKCVKCGVCAKECPADAISISAPQKTDTKKCISCMHCVAVCPNHARSIPSWIVDLAAFAMKKSCAERKQNRLFLE